MDWQDVKILEENTVKIPERWLFIHYYEALTILFRIENALRVFVYVILKQHFHNKWQDQNVASDDAGEGTIASLAKQRMNQARTFGYLGLPATCPIMYLTGGELIRFITTDAYWKYFKYAFAARKDIVKNKLDEIGTIRNSLAHFRAIKRDDVEVLKHNAKHIMNKIEQQLSDIIMTGTTVPTNTADDWYRELRSLGTDLCTLTFRQSSCAQWIKIDINYNCPVVADNYSWDMHFYELLSINGPEILKIHTDLAKFAIYMTEYIPWTSETKDTPAIFQKSISVVFHIDTLKKEYAFIKQEFEKILNTISKETELIQEDNLAKGQLVELVNVSVKIPTDKKYEYAKTAELRSPSQESDPPEWWGELKLYVSDFISGTHTYPWIRTNIARIQFFS